MARFTGYVRLLWPVRPWWPIVGANTRERCVDLVAEWISKTDNVRDEEFEFVILAESDGWPIPQDRP